METRGRRAVGAKRRPPRASGAWKASLSASAAVLASAAALLSGCSISRDYPVKQSYGLDAERTAAAADTESPPADRKPIVLRIAKFRDASIGAGTEFLYRRSDGEYVSDFYHEFVRPPELLFEQQTRVWLNQAELFASVVPRDSQIETPWALEGHIAALHADVRDAKSPKAVFEVEFLLLDSRAGEARSAWQRQYRVAQPVASDAAQVMAAGWRAALAQILANLEADLRAWPKPASP